jgi:hypothetical protein
MGAGEMRKDANFKAESLAFIEKSKILILMTK